MDEMDDIEVPAEKAEKDNNHEDMEEMLEIPPPVQVDMIVDDHPLVFNDDNSFEAVANNKEIYNEMLDEGLTTSDMEFFRKFYSDISSVKYEKIHCTSCDKHLGSAPKDMERRFCHPLLKVLVCGECFNFYCSDDFTKDDDGSEIYCRWCGEGGQVYCCSKCPYVFCKKCIKKNLGKAIADVIQNSEDWLCFNCNNLQINKQRATYWAVQKYGSIMIQDAGNNIISKDELDKDYSMCCNKKRSSAHSKTLLPQAKKQKSNAKRSKPSNNVVWLSEEQQDEVICTPDIIMDESPPHSPATLTPEEVTPPVKKITLMAPSLKKAKAIMILPKASTSNATNTILVRKPVTQSSSFVPVLTRPSKYLPKDRNQVKNLEASKDFDWFEQGVMECSEVTEYISTKIATLSRLNSCPTRSNRLVEEIFKTFQTYLAVAISKLTMIKQNMQVAHYNSTILEMPKVPQLSPVVINPTKTICIDITSDEEDEVPAGNKNTILKSDTLPPEEVLFHMDVTNESDEDNEVMEVSDDIKEDLTGHNESYDDILKSLKLKPKVNVKNLPEKDLQIYLSARVLIKNTKEMHKRFEEYKKQKPADEAFDPLSQESNDKLAPEKESNGELLENPVDTMLEENKSSVKLDDDTTPTEIEKPDGDAMSETKTNLKSSAVMESQQETESNEDTVSENKESELSVQEHEKEISKEESEISSASSEKNEMKNGEKVIEGEVNDAKKNKSKAESASKTRKKNRKQKNDGKGDTAKCNEVKSNENEMENKISDDNVNDVEDSRKRKKESSTGDAQESKNDNGEVEESGKRKKESGNADMQESKNDHGEVEELGKRKKESSTIDAQEAKNDDGEDKGLSDKIVPPVNNPSKTTFGDIFSSFLNSNSDQVKNIEEEFQNMGNFCEEEDRSLSLPPQGSFCFFEPDPGPSKSSKALDSNENGVDIDSDIIALRNLAENCLNAVENTKLESTT